MAGFLELIDNALGTHFNAPVYKPEKGRAKLVKVIDKAASQRAAGETPPTRSWKTGSNGAVSFSPKIDGKPVLIGGEAVNYVPGDRFDTFLEGLKAAVQAGDLDDEIKAALEGDEAGSAVSAPKATRKRSTTGTDDQHPKFTDPKWSTYTAGEKIQKGLAYKRTQA